MGTADVAGGLLLADGMDMAGGEPGATFTMAPGGDDGHSRCVSAQSNRVCSEVEGKAHG